MRRGDHRGRHRGEERRHAHAAGVPRAGVRDRAGRRGASGTRGEHLSHAAEDHGGRRGRRGARRHAGRARAIPGQEVGLMLCGGNIDPRILASIMVRELERENRIVSFRLTIHRPAWRARPDRDPAGRARRQYSRGRSPAAVPRRAGQGRAPRCHGRDARPPRMRTRFLPRSPPTAIGRCGSRPAPRWSDAGGTGAKRRQPGLCRHRLKLRASQRGMAGTSPAMTKGTSLWPLVLPCPSASPPPAARNKSARRRRRRA